MNEAGSSLIVYLAFLFPESFAFSHREVLVCVFMCWGGGYWEGNCITSALSVLRC